MRSKKLGKTQDADLDARNRVHCKYLAGLGYLGLGQNEEAVQYLLEVIKLDQSHSGALVHLMLANENLSAAFLER